MLVQVTNGKHLPWNNAWHLECNTNTLALIIMCDCCYCCRYSKFSDINVRKLGEQAESSITLGIKKKRSYLILENALCLLKLQHVYIYVDRYINI